MVPVVPVVLVLVPGVLQLARIAVVIRDIMHLGRGPVVRACPIVPHQKHVRHWVLVGRERITNVPETREHNAIRRIVAQAMWSTVRVPVDVRPVIQTDHVAVVILGRIENIMVVPQPVVAPVHVTRDIIVPVPAVGTMPVVAVSANVQGRTPVLIRAVPV